MHHHFGVQANMEVRNGIYDDGREVLHSFILPWAEAWLIERCGRDFTNHLGGTYRAIDGKASYAGGSAHCGARYGNDSATTDNGTEHADAN